MTGLLWGGATLAALHALLPNHWLPVVAIGAREGWGRATLAQAAALVASAHVASSVALGLLVGVLGMGAGSPSAGLMKALSGGGLILVGAWLWRSQNACGGHGHADLAAPHSGETGTRLVWGLSLALFLSPAWDLVAYYLAAARLGWPGVIAISLVYLVVTVALNVALALAGDRLRRRLEGRLHGLEHNWSAVSGGLLVALGIGSFFLDV